MKKFAVIAMAFFAAMMMTTMSSCHKTTFLKADTDTIRTTITGTKGEIRIETDGKVEIAHAPQWVKLELQEGDSVLRYEVPLNSDRKLREDSIVLKSSELTCAIFVSQTFKATYLKLNPAEVSLPRKGGTAEVEVEVDAESPLTIDNQKIAKVDGRKIIVTMEPNNTTKSVVKELKVSCDDITETLVIKQETSICKACGGTGHSNKVCSNCNGFGAHMCCNYTGKEWCQVCGGDGLGH